MKFLFVSKIYFDVLFCNLILADYITFPFFFLISKDQFDKISCSYYYFMFIISLRSLKFACWLINDWFFKTFCLCKLGKVQAYLNCHNLCKFDGNHLKTKVTTTYKYLIRVFNEINVFIDYSHCNYGNITYGCFLTRFQKY